MPPRLVIHMLRYRRVFFETGPEGKLWADPVECLMDLYEMRLEDKIYPQTQKAIEAYEAAMKKSWELTLYDDATAYATRRLGELAPADFPGLTEDVPLPKLPATADKTYSYETSY